MPLRTQTIMATIPIAVATTARGTAQLIWRKGKEEEIDEATDERERGNYQGSNNNNNNNNVRI